MKPIAISLTGLLLLVCSWATAQTSKSKVDLENELMVVSTIDSLLKDPRLNEPRKVSANHDRYRNKMLKFILKGRFKRILKIVHTDCFDVVLGSTDRGVRKLRKDEDIINLLSRFRACLKKKKVKDTRPSVVNEEFFFGDHFFLETWYIEERKIYMIVCFTNGQLVGFFIKME